MADVSERHLLLARNISFSLEKYGRDVKSLVKALALNLLTENNLSATEDLRNNLHVRNICLVEVASGQVLRALDEAATPCPPQIAEAELKGLLKYAVTERLRFSPAFLEADGKPAMHVVWRLGDKMAVATIGTDFIVDIADRVRFGEGAHAAIVDPTGRLLAHPIARWRTEIRDISALAPVQKMLSRESGVASFYSPAIEEDVIAGYTWVKGTDWGVMIPQPLAELKARALASQRHALGTIVSGGLLAIVISWMFAGYLTKPVGAVIETARRFSSGNQNLRVQVDDRFLPQELKELGHAFNAMADSVDLAYDRLSDIAESVSTPARENIHSVLVSSLARILAPDYVFFGELQTDGTPRIRTVSFFKDGREQENFEYGLSNAPCENVIGRRSCIYNGNVLDVFPSDGGLKALGVKSYIGVPVFNTQGEPIGLLVVMNREPVQGVAAIVDYMQIYANRISSEWQHQKTATQLRNAVWVAEQANRSKSEFLSNISHELRTPLNAIIGFSTVLAGQSSGASGRKTVREYASYIQRSGEHLLMLIGDLLDISKIEAGEQDLSPGNVDAEKEIRACVRMIKGQIKDRDIDIVVKEVDGLPDLFVDARHLRQILINLLSNAAKFTDAPGRIVVSAQVLGTRKVMISVEDNGPGIDRQDHAKVFEPFGQVAGSLTRNHDGAGLGLSIVKSLVELNGGTIELISALGSGTTIKMVFPVYQSQLECESKNLRAGLGG